MTLGESWRAFYMYLDSTLFLLAGIRGAFSGDLKMASFLRDAALLLLASWSIGFLTMNRVSNLLVFSSFDEVVTLPLLDEADITDV